MGLVLGQVLLLPTEVGWQWEPDNTSYGSGHADVRLCKGAGDNCVKTRQWLAFKFICFSLFAFVAFNFSQKRNLSVKMSVFIYLYTKLSEKIIKKN